MEVTAKTAKQLRLTEDEFELIKQKLGRTPNFNELCAFSGMWSEHCSYKNSIKWLKTLPREGGRMLVKAGEENAGLMDIGDGYGVVFKNRIAQPSVRYRTVPGRGYRGWRHSPRHLYHGGPAGSCAQLPAFWQA
jgi:hypothetical protein